MSMTSNYTPDLRNVGSIFSRKNILAAVNLKCKQTKPSYVSIKSSFFVWNFNQYTLRLLFYYFILSHIPQYSKPHICLPSNTLDTGIRWCCSGPVLVLISTCPVAIEVTVRVIVLYSYVFLLLLALAAWIKEEADHLWMWLMYVLPLNTVWCMLFITIWE